MEGLKQPKEGFWGGERGERGKNMGSSTLWVKDVMLHRSSVA